MRPVAEKPSTLCVVMACAWAHVSDVVLETSERVRRTGQKKDREAGVDSSRSQFRPHQVSLTKPIWNCEVVQPGVPMSAETNDADVRQMLAAAAAF